MTDHSAQICVVNCGLPADQCACQRSTLTALPPEPALAVKVKPLDLTQMLQHAFLSGFVAARNIPAHEPCDGNEAWAAYEPVYDGSPYDRIRAAIIA